MDQHGSSLNRRVSGTPTRPDNAGRLATRVALVGVPPAFVVIFMDLAV